LVTGSWKRLVFDKPGLPAGAVDRSAYVICVLEQFPALREAPGDLRTGLDPLG
jgi:hypothetical protein